MFHFISAINCKQFLLKEIKIILDDSWLHIKHQVNFFTFACMLACGFYMFSCIFANYYYTHIQPQNFTLQLRKLFSLLRYISLKNLCVFFEAMPALFPMWHDYGMTWPYYPIQYFIAGIENYICGMCK